MDDGGTPPPLSSHAAPMRQTLDTLVQENMRLKTELGRMTRAYCELQTAMEEMYTELVAARTARVAAQEALCQHARRTERDVEEQQKSVAVLESLLAQSRGVSHATKLNLAREYNQRLFRELAGYQRELELSREDSRRAIVNNYMDSVASVYRLGEAQHADEVARLRKHIDALTEALLRQRRRRAREQRRPGPAEALAPTPAPGPASPLVTAPTPAPVPTRAPTLARAGAQARARTREKKPSA